VFSPKRVFAGRTGGHHDKRPIKDSSYKITTAHKVSKGKYIFVGERAEVLVYGDKQDL
jgi:hypothetical protein